MEQIGVFALGTEHKLDPGNQTHYHHIDGRHLYGAVEMAIWHSAKIIAVGRDLRLRGWSTDHLFEVRKCSHHPTRMRLERQVKNLPQNFGATEQERP